MKAAQAMLAAQKELLKACNKDISEKINDQRALQKDDNAAQLQLQELEHKVTKCKKDAKDAARQVSPEWRLLTRALNFIWHII